jgi:transcriptional regulator with XRE-family HTH domain
MKALDIRERCTMSMLFAETLKKLRTEKGLSQRELAGLVFVTRPAIARWENGSRLPDAVMISRLAQYLGVGVDTLLNAAAKSDEAPNVIMVDDTKIVLTGGLPVLEEVMPNAIVVGFTRPSEALDYARTNRVALAFLDIEMGKTNGLELCRSLLEINPLTNVVFLTAYTEYALDAWSTGACGFMLKPITPEGVREQLKNLRYPFSPGGAGA